MPDGLNIPIEVSFTTTGDSTATMAVKSLGDAADVSSRNVSRSGNVIEQVAQRPLSDFADAAEKGGKNTKNLGMAANSVSYQMQDFVIQVGGGTSAITAFAQQAPQLIDGLRMAGVLTGGMGAAMMGIAAAIPIVSFGGKALFQWLNRETEISLDQVIKAQKKKVDEASRVYAESARKDMDKRLKEAKHEADEIARIYAGIENRRDAANILTELTAQRDTAAATIAQINSRLDLERIESALVTATGQTALRLARERLEKIEQIRDREREIQDIQDSAKLTKAATNLGAAQESFDIAKRTDYKRAAEFESLSKTIAELKEKSENLKQSYQDQAAAIKRQISELESKRSELEQKNPDASLTGNTQYAYVMRDLLNQINALREKLKPLNEQARETTAIDRKVETLEPLRRAAEKDMEDAAQRQIEAAKALSKAASDLSSLRQSTATANTVKDAQEAAARTAEISKAVTAAGRKALETGGAYVPNQGLPGYDTAKDRLNALLTDQTPDAEQAQELLGIINELKNTLGQKDAGVMEAFNGLAKIVSGTLDQIKTMKQRVSDLETKSNQQR